MINIKWDEVGIDQNYKYGLLIQKLFPATKNS